MFGSHAIASNCKKEKCVCMEAVRGIAADHCGEASWRVARPSLVRTRDVAMVGLSRRRFAVFEERGTESARSYETGRVNALRWGIVAGIGILLIVLGILAIGAAFTAGVVSIVFLGSLLVVGGIGEIIGAFRLRERGLAVPFLAGLLSAIVGALLALQPIAGLAAAGALIGAYYLASGLFRGITSVIDRYPHWGWDFFYGIVAIVLGGYVLGTWPISSLWLVGTLVGIELVVRGAAWMGAGFALRKMTRLRTA
jgi:uncharacterized membrane protein HdeD (DUF308 family)